MRPSTPWPMSAGSRTPPGVASTTQARVRRPGRRARPGLARRPAAASGDRLLRDPAHRADPGRLRRHPRPPGGGDPAVPRHLPQPGAPRWPRPRRGQDGQDGDGQQPTGKTGERFKVACGCQPPRSFWIRAKQYTPGPITCGVCGQDFQPQDTTPGRHHRHTVCDDLAPGDLDAVDSHDRHHHHHARVGQDLGGLVGFERHRAQRGGERVATVPQPPPTRRAAVDLDTAWSRSRTPHPGRWLGDQYWLPSLGQPGRAGPPTRVAPAGRAAGRCVAPPPPPAARRRRPGLA
jgi:hypothetical protein